MADVEPEPSAASPVNAEDEELSADAAAGVPDSSEDASPGGIDEEAAAAVRAELGNLSADLGSQLKAITEEMTRIKSELYSEGGIGGFAKELRQLQGETGNIDGDLSAKLGKL